MESGFIFCSKCIREKEIEWKRERLRKRKREIRIKNIRPQDVCVCACISACMIACVCRRCACEQVCVRVRVCKHVRASVCVCMCFWACLCEWGEKEETASPSNVGWKNHDLIYTRILKKVGFSLLFIFYLSRGKNRPWTKSFFFFLFKIRIEKPPCFLFICVLSVSSCIEILEIRWLRSFVMQ